MKRIKDSLALSATDLVGYLNCRHLTELDRAVAEGSLAKPKVRDDPLLQLLAEPRICPRAELCRPPNEKRFGTCQDRWIQSFRRSRCGKRLPP